MLITAIIDKIVNAALEEDLSWGDVTTETLISPDWKSRLKIILKQDGVVSGMEVAQRVFLAVDSDLEWEASCTDGEVLSAGSVLATAAGKSQSLLIAERIALNFLQRMSGIATLTNAFVSEARKGSNSVKVTDTRKTTPGLRYLEKYAVRIGGGFNHRFNLSDAILIKDNHIAMLANNGKTVGEAIRESQNRVPHTTVVEMEVDSLDQIEEALEAGASIVLLDNMSNEQLRKAVALIDGRVLAEASGGVNLETIREIAATGVDLISVGALTHSAASLDISLDYDG